MPRAIYETSTSHRWPAGSTKPGTKPAPIPLPILDPPPRPPAPLSGRRALLSAATAAALGIAAIAPALAAPAESNPDAELIALCAAFCALEGMRAGNDGYSEEPAVSEVFRARQDAITDEQEPLVERICALPCTTPEGARALARAYAAWIEPSELVDQSGAYMETRLIGALVRGLIGKEDVA